jgi:hypothetical protein
MVGLPKAILLAGIQICECWYTDTIVDIPFGRLRQQFPAN